jgi:hypothetical protein
VPTGRQRRCCSPVLAAKAAHTLTHVSWDWRSADKDDQDDQDDALLAGDQGHLGHLGHLGTLLVLLRGTAGGSNWQCPRVPVICKWLPARLLSSQPHSIHDPYNIPPVSVSVLHLRPRRPYKWSMIGKKSGAGTVFMYRGHQ